MLLNFYLSPLNLFLFLFFFFFFAFFVCLFVSSLIMKVSQPKPRRET